MKVIVIGGGFGGLRLARKLSNRSAFDVTLIDKHNYHEFQPLFYQVATAGLDASNISFPLRKVFHGSKNVRIKLAEVKQIISAQNKVVTDIGEFEYDVLVIATGAGTNFFGNQSIIDHALPMKSTAEALELRYRFLHNFEKAVSAKNEKDLLSLLTIIVVGGGPTGVELSGAIADMRKYVLPKDYPELDFSKMTIYLLEGLDKTLAAMTEASSRDSRRYLEKLGVKVLTNTTLKEYDGVKATLQNGETIDAATLIWAAGVKGNVPEGIDKDLIAKGNRIKVDHQNRVEGLTNIYAIGDVAYLANEFYPNGHPQLSPVAIQQADILAKNLHLIETQSNKPLKDFIYTDKGTMATVGRNLAVVDLTKPKLHFGGLFAWLTWMLVHLFLTLGVKNRFFILLNWVYNYFTYDQNLRLIFRDYDSNKIPAK
jgi:NADH dehydrogenase